MAVKRLVMIHHTDNLGEFAAEMKAASRRLISVKRELRVLTHPKLRSHPYLISAIAWGWHPNPGGSKRPYLVMSYANMGTLAHFAQKRSLSLIERRLLARDVAMGIRSLHDCNIVHDSIENNTLD